MERTRQKKGVDKARASAGQGKAAEIRFELIKALCINHVPKQDAISIERAITAKVTQCYGGTAIYIKKSGVRARSRAAKVISEVGSGATVSECAIKHGISNSQVRHILKQQRAGAKTISDDGAGGTFIEGIICGIEEQLGFRGIKAAADIAIKVGEHLELRFFGEGAIYIPKMAHKGLSERNTRLYQEYQDGATYQDLADKYCITTRQVYNTIKKAREMQCRK